MRKTFLVVAMLALAVANAFAAATPEDKIEISGQVERLVNSVNDQDLSAWGKLISPTARPGLLDEVVASVAGRRLAFQESIKSFKDMEDGRVKVKGGYSLEDVNTSIKGMPNFFVFEKVNGKWLIYDTNFHKKFDGNDVFWLVGIIFAVVFILMIPLFAFWIWMLIDVISKPGDNRTPWVLAMVFAGFIGSILYFFLVYRKRKKGYIQPQV